MRSPCGLATQDQERAKNFSNRGAPAQLSLATTETESMVNVARFALARLSALLCVTSSCTWSDAQPTLVFQLSRVTRGRLTEVERTRTRELAFTAAIAMALDRPEVLPADDMGFAPLSYAPVDAQVNPAALSCEAAPSTLCAWARTAEESAFAVAIERAEVEP
jgi:hypothetical protein